MRGKKKNTAFTRTTTFQWANICEFFSKFSSYRSIFPLRQLEDVTLGYSIGKNFKSYFSELHKLAFSTWKILGHWSQHWIGLEGLQKYGGSIKESPISYINMYSNFASVQKFTLEINRREFSESTLASNFPKSENPNPKYRKQKNFHVSQNPLRMLASQFFQNSISSDIDKLIFKIKNPSFKPPEV